MLIEYKNGKQKEVKDFLANVLIQRGLVKAVYETRQIEPEQTEEVEISALTGKPKRQYRRRDMQAEG